MKTEFTRAVPRIRLQSLQLLRGLAVLLVISTHAFGMSEQFASIARPAFLPTIFEVQGFGASGVDLFFVISGFVIAMSLDANGGDKGARRFFRERFRRIAPLFWLLSLAMLPQLFLIADDPLPAMIYNTISFLPFADGDTYSGTIVFSGWSLGFEMLFYLIAALLIPTGSMRLIWLGVALTGLALAGLILGPAPVIVKWIANPILFEFVLGLISYGWWRHGITHACSNVALMLGTVILGATLVWGIGGTAGYKALVDGTTSFQRTLLWGLPWMLIIVGLANRTMSGRLGAALIRVGDASYSFYLSHSLILIPTIWLARRADAFPPDLIILLFFVACFPLGFATYRWLERPLTRLVARQSDHCQSLATA